MTSTSVRSAGFTGTLLLLLTTPASAGEAAIASPDRYGADAAAKVLRAGGNAVDAAVAIAFTLAVTFPDAGNLGGGGFATVVIDGKSYFLDYRETAPHVASAGMYLDASGNVIPGASTIGARAAAVPGTVRGLWELHQRFGKLSWPMDLAPAITCAEGGFTPDKQMVERERGMEKVFGTHTNFSRYFHSLDSSSLFRQPQLAATLRRVAIDGPKGFYQGHTADLIVAEMRRGGGLIDRKDLAKYRAVWREPLEADWGGYHVVTAPLPSSGGVGLISLLKMKADLASLFAGVPHNSPQYVHLLAEMEKRVFADRAQFLGDPDFSHAPLTKLLSNEYIRRRALEVNPTQRSAMSAVRPGTTEHHNTTHFSVVDQLGNAVSNTYTLNDDFGSGVVVTGAGFLLNNEMDDFSAKPGAPNLYGVVGGEANAIAPGKRPLSSMTPTILTQAGHVALVIGTPGGSRIFTSVFQVIVNWHDFQMPLAQAVDAARIHHQLLPADTLYEEPYRTLEPATRAELIARGYVVENQGWNGDIQAVEVNGDHAVAASDPRGWGEGRVIK